MKTANDVKAMSRAEVSRRRPSPGRSLVLIGGVPAVFVLYVLSALVVFDFSASAQSMDEENYDGKRVAFGPLPRWPFCYGGNLDIPGGWDFHGDEPVFWVYRPVCDLWRAAKSYEAPSVWRR